MSMDKGDGSEKVTHGSSPVSFSLFSLSLSLSLSHLSLWILFYFISFFHFS